MSNSKFSDFTSDQRQQNLTDTVGKFKSSYAEAREAIVKAAAGDGIIYNEDSPLDTRDLFNGLKFSEQRYASAKCRMEKAKSYSRSAKKYLKNKDYIAMLHYMRCSMCNACSALLDLVQGDDEQYMNVMLVFEQKYIETGLFARQNFVFLKKITVLVEKIVRGDFFRMPRESFNEALTRVEIFLEAAEEVLSCYYKCTNKEIENSTGGI